MGAQQAMGIISIGSNDIHLLVASSDGVTTFHPEINHSVLAELVGTLQANVLPVVAVNQALCDLDTLVTMAHNAKAYPILALGTEALREARNGPAFLELAATTLGIEACAITGEEEAALDYRWATSPFPPNTPGSERAKRVTAPEQEQASVLAVDSGGGSTQVVLGAGPIPTFSRSLPIGAGNLTQQWIKHDPPKRAELQALRDHVSSLVDTLPPPPMPPDHIVAMGGSADHLVCLTAHPKRSRLTVAALDELLVTLQKKSAAELAQKYTLPVERVRLLPAGAATLQALLRHYSGVEAQVKANGIRGAVVVSYARDGDHWRQGLASSTPLTAQTSAAKLKHERAVKKN
jgi:exopolyphosphatase/guanosine-5'-triphosphate,3'-diphosphate pyrophosphatase